jgi:hypothetical protein
MLGRRKRPPAAQQNPLTAPATVPTRGAQREALIARYMQQFIETAIALPDVLAQDRKDIRKWWSDRGNKAPLMDSATGKAKLDPKGQPMFVDIDKGQIDYDVGTVLAQRARNFANGIVDQVLPMPKSPPPFDDPAAAERPHVGRLDPVQAGA